MDDKTPYLYDDGEEEALGEQGFAIRSTRK